MAAESVTRMSSAASSLCNFNGSQRPVPVSNRVTSSRRNRCVKLQSLASASMSEFFGSSRLCFVNASRSSGLSQKTRKNGFSVIAMAAAEGIKFQFIFFWLEYQKFQLSGVNFKWVTCKDYFFIGVWVGLGVGLVSWVRGVSFSVFAMAAAEGIKLEISILFCLEDGKFHFYGVNY